MPPVGFEPTIAVLERAKTFRALERAATAFPNIVNMYILVMLNDLDLLLIRKQYA
jgi:hypothetical protein